MSSKASDDNIARLKANGEYEAFVGEIESERNKSELMLRAWRYRVMEYVQLYQMFQPKKNYEGLANIFVPEILRAVETFVSVIYRAFFGSDPWYEYVGRTKDDDDSARTLTQLTSWQMDANKFKITIQDVIRQMAITGIGILKLSWDFEQRTVTTKKVKKASTIDTILSLGRKNKKIETIEEIETVKDHWRIDPVDPLGFYIADVAVPYYDINRAEWLGEEFRVTKNWVNKQIKKGWYSDNAIEDIHETVTTQGSDTQNLKNILLVSVGYHNMQDMQGIVIFERWGLVKAKRIYTSEQLDSLKLEPDDMVEAVIVTANHNQLLKLEANPYSHKRKPYLICPYVPKGNEFNGIGISQIAQPLQQELNDTRNQIMDNKTFNIATPWLRKRTSGVKKEDLKLMPWKVVDTNDMDGLRPLPPTLFTAPGINVEGVIKNDLRESVGIPSNLQGIAQAGVSTATESTQINQSAMGRISLTSQLFSELVLRPLLSMVEFLNYQFYDQEQVISIVGEEGIYFKKVNPDDIVGEKDVMIKFSTDLDDNPGVRRQQLIQFLSVIQNIPPQLLGMYWKILDKLYKEFFTKGHGLEDILPMPPELDKSLDPKDENAIMIMGRSVEVKPIDDDDAHLDGPGGHLKFFDTMKYGCGDDAFKAMTEHIEGHQKNKANKQAQQAQALQQKIENFALDQQGGQPMAGTLNKGQAPNMSAFTQTNTPTPGNLNGMNGA